LLNPFHIRSVVLLDCVRKMITTCNIVIFRQIVGLDLGKSLMLFKRGVSYVGTHCVPTMPLQMHTMH
jgi:hypothetical protein